jgi:nitrogen fixation protein NifU and related proteins
VISAEVPDVSDDPLYREELMDHYFASSHRGRIARPDLSAELENPLCGDHVRLELRVDSQGRIAQARFDGDGCVISQAATSLLSERIEGSSLREACQLSVADMLQLLGVPLTPMRQKCGLLGWRVLQRALADRTNVACPENRTTCEA